MFCQIFHILEAWKILRVLEDLNLIVMHSKSILILNQYEASLINDVTFKSNKNISKNGFINSYTLLFRNANSDLRNSLNFENQKILIYYQLF